jgi:hypothetical protein
MGNEIKTLNYRIYLNQVSDMQKEWNGGHRMEYLAMDYIARKIHEKYIILRKTSITS